MEIKYEYYNQGRIFEGKGVLKPLKLKKVQKLALFITNITYTLWVLTKGSANIYVDE